MGELRWVLLVIGAVVIAAVYAYSRSRQSSDQSSGSRHEPVLGDAELDDSSAVPDAPVETTASIEPPVPEKIVAIRLLSRDRRGFPAEQLVLALRGAGLRHGQFGIFHAHPESSPQQTTFSVASLTEPGSFDLSNLKTGRYPGVSLFLALPGPLDGITAFDQMMETARGLAHELEGDLSDEQGSTLSVQRERYLREEIIQFQHGDARI
jgi:cell division protein ZipA